MAFILLVEALFILFIHTTSQQTLSDYLTARRRTLAHLHRLKTGYGTLRPRRNSRRYRGVFPHLLPAPHPWEELVSAAFLVGHRIRTRILILRVKLCVLNWRIYSRSKCLNRLTYSLEKSRTLLPAMHYAIQVIRCIVKPSTRYTHLENSPYFLANRVRTRLRSALFTFFDNITLRLLCDIPQICYTPQPDLQQGIHFDGACPDTGATNTVIGLEQAKHYCAQHGIKLKLQPSTRSFRFGPSVQSSLGTLRIRMPIGKDGMVTCYADVVDTDVPFLLGLDLMSTNAFVIETDHRDPAISHKTHGWRIPLVHKYGHLYWEWPTDEVLFTRAELEKIHLQFYHPSAQKLYNLLKRAKPEETTHETRELLTEIARHCTTCSTFSTRGLRFKVSMPDENLVFNQSLAMDLMYIDGKTVLHVVDIATGFSNGAFLEHNSAAHVWETFIRIWATVYPGHPDKVKVDSGSIFTSDYWQKQTTACGIDLQFSGVESHNSLGLGERFHAPLRRIYKKIRHDHPSLQDPKLVLRLAIKAMNDTMGPDGLVPSLCVFGVLPRLPTVPADLPKQADRMVAIETARKEMETITAQLRLKQALNSKLPPAARYVFAPGDLVRWWREGSRKYHGPYKVIQAFDKELILEVNGSPKHVNITQVAPERFFVPPPPHPPKDKAPAIVPLKKRAPTSHIETLHSQLRDFRRDCPTNRFPFGLRNQKRPNAPTTSCRIFITEVIHPADKRCKLPQFGPAKRKELLGLFKRNTWKIVLRSEVPDGANILRGRFVLSIKDIETGEPIYKARFVVQGHKDKEKDLLIHDSNNIQQTSIRMLVALAAVFGFSLWSHDVTQAYLQSATKLLRDVYIVPNKEMELGPDVLLKLLRPLYGLPDAGDYWHATYEDHLKKDINMQQAVSDLAFFFKLIDGKLQGLAGTYVDDTLLAGTLDFQRDTEATLHKFESRDRQETPFTFAGIQIDSLPNKGFIMHQRGQIDRLSLLSSDSTFKQFKSRIMQLAWITHTRPEICCAIAQAAQITAETFTPADIKPVNSAIRALKANPSEGLRHHRLDANSLCVRVYTDSSFANNRDCTSQLGYIIVLADKTGRCNVLCYRSGKSRRVTRSVLGAEVYAFADGFDRAYAIRHDLQRILRRNVPLQMFTDSKSLFDVLVSNSHTVEKRLMIDLHAARQSYRSEEIDDIGLLRSADNPADAFTKVGHCAALWTLLRTNTTSHIPVVQWVVRNRCSGPSSQVHEEERGNVATAGQVASNDNEQAHPSE